MACDVDDLLLLENTRTQSTTFVGQYSIITVIIIFMSLYGDDNAETVGHNAIGWCIKLWDITSLGSVQAVRFFDVVARFCAVDGPIAVLVGGSSCGIGCALQHCTLYV